MSEKRISIGRRRPRRSSSPTRFGRSIELPGSVVATFLPASVPRGWTRSAPSGETEKKPSPQSAIR